MVRESFCLDFVHEVTVTFFFIKPADNLSMTLTKSWTQP